MWRFTLKMLNPPRVIGSSAALLLIVRMVPGNGGKEPNKLEPYIEALADEVLELHNSLDESHF